MALDLPDSSAVVSNRAKADVRRELAQSKPFVRRSYLGAIVTGIANRVFEFYGQLRESELESNPLTAVRNLERFAAGYGYTRLPGRSATGQIFLNATPGDTGTVIPNNTNFVSGNGSIYPSSGDSTIGVVFAALSSLTYSGTTATATTASPHGLASNAIVTIAGATQSAYNLADVPIVVTSDTTFTYELTATPAATPATGSPLFAGFGATINVQATDAGADQNLDPDAELSFEVPITGLEQDLQVIHPGILDGTDVETDDALRARLLDRIQNPVANFNVAQITARARRVSGVTRVFVQENTPAIGQVTVYFLRDLDADPIPSAAEVDEVEAELIAIKPAHTADSDVIVSAPTAVETDFAFSSITPDTPAMRTAIRASLTDFFATVPEVGVAVQEDAYRSAIFNTLDPSTGNRVTSFSLSSPAAGNLTATGAQIRTLGSVSF